jgi:phosphoserine aminotransferase
VQDGIDTYVLTHCETSTGVLSPLDSRLPVQKEDLVVADGTSAAGGVPLEPGAVDIYFFSLQKGLAADGGLWAAFFSPAAQTRVAAVRAATRRSGGDGGRAPRWIPAILDLDAAIEASAKDQTVNTPAVATLVLAVAQLEWLLEEGGLAFGVARSAESARRLYAWAERSPAAQPFVEDPAARSPVVATIELDPAIDARTVVATLRAHGIVDLDPYRGVGRNQIRVGLFPAIDPDDVDALTTCLDTVIEALCH